MIDMAGDDHERATCPRAGEIGHWMCGVCHRHRRPRYECGCRAGVRHPYEPEAYRFALLLSDRQIDLSARDEDTASWAATPAAQSILATALDAIGVRWLNRAIEPPRDLKIIATELSAMLSAAQRETGVHVEVRACEYRDVVVRQQLVEL
jgi:hypothetical protein